MPKNVTPNCFMLETVLGYFKNINVFLDQWEDVMVLHCKSHNLKTHLEVNRAVREKIGEITEANALAQLFGLKDVKTHDFVISD